MNYRLNIEESAKSYEDPAKARTRERLRNFIATNLEVKVRDAKIVCFPGAEQRGQEGIEIVEVYDQLGVPRRNIVGLESDPQRAKRLEDANLGIEIVNSDANTFFKYNQRVFDVISLDYCGPQTLEEADTLGYIASQGQLSPTGILCTNYLGRRESRQLQALLAARVANASTLRLRKTVSSSTELIDAVHSLLSDCRERVSQSAISSTTEEDKSKLREGVSLETRTIFLAGAFDQPIPKHLFSGEPGIPRVAEQVRKYYLDGEFDDEIQDYSQKTGLDFESVKLRSIDSIYKEVSKLSFLSHYWDLVFNLMKLGLDQESASSCILACDEKFSSKYHINKIERYSYISNSGSPMLFDLFSFKKARYGMINKASELIQWDEQTRSAIFGNQSHSASQLLRDINYIRRTYRELVANDALPLPERVFLGSSAKPILTKQRAIEEFRRGASIEEIKAKYRGCTNKPLAQWKAHQTMGTYDLPDEEETLSVAPEDSDLEKITREDAIDLLSEGIPIGEIISAYPTSFTKGQLAAFKAHLTMGTYKTPSE